MPAYDYKCPWCQTIKEVTHSMSFDMPVKCDNNGCEAVMEKQISKLTFRKIKIPGTVYK